MRVFFCNSGTEANEAAIKLARKRAFRERRAASARRSSRAAVRSTGARSARSPRPPTPRITKASGRCRRASRSRPFNDVAALETARSTSASRRYRRAGAGRERRASVASAEFLSSGAATLQRARCAADLRRDPVRDGPASGRSLRSSSSACGRISSRWRRRSRTAYRSARLLADERAAMRLCSRAITARPSAARRFRARPRSRICAFATSSISTRACVDVPRNSSKRCARWRGLRPDVFGAPRGMGLLIGLPVVAPHEASAVASAPGQVGCSSEPRAAIRCASRRR